MKVEFHLDKKQSPTTEKGMKVTYGQAKRGGYRLRWNLLLAVVISPLLVMAYFLFKDTVLTISPGIVTAFPVTLTAPQKAVVKTVSVKNGEEIKEQQVLVELWDSVLAEDIESLQQQVVNIDETLRNEPQNSLAEYEIAVADANANVKEMKTVLNKYKKFSRQGQVSEIDLASAQQMYNSAQLALDRAEIDLIRAKEEIVQNNLAGPVAQSRRSMILQLGKLHAQQQELNIESPFTGNVSHVFVQMGQRVEQGDAIVMVSPDVTPKVITYLSPEFIESAQVGNATVSEPTEIADKLPPQLAKPFEGSPALLRVTLSLEETIPKSKWVEGMPVEVYF